MLDQYDVVAERCINHSRALYSLRILNDRGVRDGQHGAGGRRVRQQAPDDQRADGRGRALAAHADRLFDRECIARPSSASAIPWC